MLPIGFLLRLKTDSGKHHAVPVLKGKCRSLRLSSSLGLVAVLPEIIRWGQNGFGGVTASIRMVKIIMQAPAFLSAQGGANN